MRRVNLFKDFKHPQHAHVRLARPTAQSRGSPRDALWRSAASAARRVACRLVDAGDHVARDGEDVAGLAPFDGRHGGVRGALAASASAHPARSFAVDRRHQPAACCAADDAGAPAERGAADRARARAPEVAPAAGAPAARAPTSPAASACRRAQRAARSARSSPARSATLLSDAAGRSRHAPPQRNYLPDEGRWDPGDRGAQPRQSASGTAGARADGDASRGHDAVHGRRQLPGERCQRGCALVELPAQRDCLAWAKTSRACAVIDEPSPSPPSATAACPAAAASRRCTRWRRARDGSPTRSKPAIRRRGLRTTR